MKLVCKKSIFWGMALIITMGVSTVGVQAKDIVWRWDIQIPATHVYTKEIYVPFAEAVNARTGADFKIKTFPSSGTGLKPSTQLRGLKNNIIDMSEVNTGWNTGDEPLLSIVSLPCLYHSQQEVVKGLNALEKQLIEPLEKKWDMKILWVSPIDEQIAYSVKTVRNLEDFKGKKMRTYQRWMEMWANAFGARSVNVPYPEQYSAYERKVMDAGVTGSATGVSMKFWEVVECAYTGLGLDYIPMFIAVSGKSWRKLPKKYQDVLLELAKKYGPMQVERANSVQEENYKKFEENGMIVVRATPEEVKTSQSIAKEKVWPVFIKEQGANGQAMIDAVMKALAP